MLNWLIFTDLDGTLLDHDDYSFTQAIPALEKIAQFNIPLIINSSKTYAEIKDIRKKMHNHWAFAVENGAAIFLPQSNLSGYGSEFEQIILGTTFADLLKVIHALREQYGFCFTGFNDYSVQDLMQETGLDEYQAFQAKQRLASEPIKWLDSVKNLTLFKQLLERENLQLIQGGRFLHVMGQNDKSLAMAWLLSKFSQSQKKQTFALGDSENDTRMLEQADYAGVIRQVDGSYVLLNKQPERIFYAQHPAPLGWQEVMQQFFALQNIGESNE